MQITIDFNIRTLIALVATILGITGILTIFLLYRTYKYEIGQFFRRLFQYAPRFPTLAYFSRSTNSDLVYYEHPGNFYSSEPYNHLATPYVDPHDEFVYPTDTWNTGTGDWDTEPSSYYGSGTIPHRHRNPQSGSLSTTIPLTDPEDDPPRTLRAPVPQLPLIGSPDREWSTRLEETLHLHDTGYLASSLMGVDPQARMTMEKAPTPVAQSDEARLSPIILGSTPSPTRRSPVPLQPTIPMSPAPSPPRTPMSPASPPRNEPGAPPTEIPEVSRPLPPPPAPTMDLDEAIWQFLTRKIAVAPPILRNATINDLFHHYTHALLDDPTWLLTTAGWDYMFFTYDMRTSVEYILREEAAVHAATTWNRVHPWNERMEVPPGYEPILAGSPKPMTLTPPTPPRHADVPEYPSRPPSHTGRPVGRHPLAGRYAGGADPGRDQGGHVSPPKADDPKLRSVPRGPGAPMPPDLPNPWDIGTTQTNPWNELKPKIVREPAPFKGESVDVRRFFNQCEMYFKLHQHWLTSSPHRVVFCASRFEGEAYPLYSDFKKAVHDRFYQDADAKLKYQALKKLRQTDFKSGKVFFQKFEELALEADVIDNEGQMAQMIEEAVRKTAKDTIYAQPNCPPDTYKEWKCRILQIDYNWRLNRAARGQQVNRPNNAGTSKGSSGTTTSSANKKMGTGTTYGGRGQPMDIDAINNGECFRCHQKGHISKNCPLQSWNKKKEEVRASMTEPATGSKIEEVKDAAGK
ncbi:uncharacterized protein ARMOST_16981 [Armillaria ostoyae]|uniref:CCHC-type domain-containing protein n=1 Tax=Armillaria ostoyae TaxID=47428 RepID=A0A284RXQ6_ARMOS|nr:uncharacterized protein ARMOST_16981 [Armillaria ostoyae]